MACLATFSGQLYFRRSYFFILLQSNYFNTTFTFSEQLCFQGSCLFDELLFQNSHFFAAIDFQNSYFFRAKLLPSSHFLRIGISLGKLLFGTATFLVEEMLRIKISTEELFSEAGTSAQHQLF